MAGDERPSLGRRLRGAARPSLGVGLTLLGVAVAVAAVVAGRSGGKSGESAQPVRVCRTQSVAATARRQASVRVTVERRRRITSTKEATAGPGGASVRVTTTRGRTLVVRATVTGRAGGEATARGRARACAVEGDRREAAFRAALGARRQATSLGQERAAPGALRAARANAQRRAERSAGASADRRIERAVVTEQPDLDADTEQAAREAAQGRVTSP